MRIYIAKLTARILVGICLVSYSPSYILASTTSEPFRWDNENWFTEPHPRVTTFSVLDDGSAYGYTETGVYFTQYNILNTAGIRVQRFEMQDHYHYIVEGEIVYTHNELSIKLAKALAQIEDVTDQA